MKYLLKRNVTSHECPWLERDFKAGDKVYEYRGPHISSDGSKVYCTEEEYDTSFFELPKNALVQA